jgi:uncharacterized membrane protein
MDLFLSLAVLFAFGSLGGWCLELLFRRFVSSHKWINPGFLVGPCLPIYGLGVCFLFLISYFIDFHRYFSIPNWLNSILVILIMGIVMTLLEYIAGIIFIKGMKIKLWDYSSRKGNIQGIICPLFSLIWTLVGALFYFLLKTPCEKLLVWFGSHADSSLYFPFLLGIFYGIFIVDLAYSFHLSSRIKKLANEYHIIVKYEKFKEDIASFNEQQKQRINFLLPFTSSTSLKEQFVNHMSKMSSLKEKIDEKIKKKN